TSFSRDWSSDVCSSDLLEGQAQGFPVDGQQGLAGHPGECEQVTVQRGARQGFAMQAEGGIEEFFLALPVFHVHTDASARRVEAGSEERRVGKGRGGWGA